MPDDPLADALCMLIRTGELSPGERVDQRVVAERLNVSRTPLREALRALASDGILTRVPNSGYAVAKLSATDLLQYYSMRTLLETEILRTIVWPDQTMVESLKAINEECREAGEADDVERLIVSNRTFHFITFSWSPLTMFANEVERIWRISDPYRALHYLSNRERRGCAYKDHKLMIAAIEARDREELVHLIDRHRAGSRTMLQDMLGPSHTSAVLTLPQSARPSARRLREAI